MALIYFAFLVFSFVLFVFLAMIGALKLSSETQDPTPVPPKVSSDSVKEVI